MIDANDEDELGLNDRPEPAPASLASPSAQDDQPSAQSLAPKATKAPQKLKSTTPRSQPLPSAGTVVTQTASIPPQSFNDSSQPLNNARYERMCQLRLSGATQAQCYKATSKVKCTKGASEVGSSKIFARDDVQRRMAYLSIQVKTVPKSQVSEPKRQVLTSDRQVASGTASLTEIESALSQALRSGTTSDKVQAAKQLLAMMPDEADKDSAPDPAIFTAWLASIAGTPGPDIVREIGGSRFIVDRICAALNISRDDLKSMI